MKNFRICAALAAPLALSFGPAPAQAQQTVPAPTPEANETRKLETEIEQYPGPNDGVVDEAEARIPEEIHPAPARPRAAPTRRSAAASSAPAPNAPMGASANGSVNPSEVQRVFGRDTELLQLSELSPSQITRLQTRLRDLGHYLGKIDGVAGPKTRAALVALAHDQFALSRRLLLANQLTRGLAEQVGLEPAARGPTPASP